MVKEPTLASLAYLLPSTSDVLLRLSDFEFISEFTLVGGSCLTLYLNHRLSEDLDFFSPKDSLPKKDIFNALRNFKNAKIINESNSQMDLIIEGVKVTFFANNWDALMERKQFKNSIYIATLNLMMGLKVNTLFLRAKYRDYYDIYCISKSGYPIDQIYTIAHGYLPTLSPKLFQMALIYTDDILDDSVAHLKPSYKINKLKIGLYFQKLIRNWLEK
ncbi:MAG: nucleotidyl transferase AbiEii/AbiGii toxin family protein [Saprospiraceae bacterium]|jgi:hypothetical protein|nr:nucleotidyl transferase AbiEii/AbiGii toxin family protein [Saprospiraceae bacterium]